MSVELEDIKPSGRRRSFEEAVERSRQVETDIDQKSPSSTVGEIPELQPYESSPKKSTMGLGEKFEDVREFVPKLLTSKIFWIVVAVVAGVAALLIVILVPLTFSDLDYWEVGGTISTLPYNGEVISLITL